jgi:cysteine-rich repeat protein
MNISKLAGVVCGAACLLGHRVALADISIGNSGATVNFTGFTGTVGFSPTPATGGLSSNDWAISGFSDGDLNFGGTNANADYTRGATFPGAGAGGIYAPTSGSVFLGIRLSDTDFSPGVITARFKNTGTHKFIQLGLAYDLLVYNDNDRVSSVAFAWSTDNVNYTTVAAMGQNTPGTAAGAPAWVVTAKSTTITTNIATNGNLYLRWTSDDVSGTGSRDAIGLDNIVITVPDVCGDGVNNGGAEECDDGNTVNTDACLNNCHIAACGDGVVRSTGATPEQCDSSAAMCCSNNCTTLTGTTCPGGTCAAGTCVPTSGGGGEAGDTSMAGDGNVAGETGMGGAGEGGSAAGRGGRMGRGGMGGETAGGPAAGTSGAPAAGTAGAPAAGTSGGGAGGTAGTPAGGTSAGGRGGSSGSGNTGGTAKGGSAGTGSKPPPSSSSDDDSGCGCSVPRSESHGTLALVLVGALATFMRRRRRS